MIRPVPVALSLSNWPQDPKHARDRKLCEFFGSSAEPSNKVLRAFEDFHLRKPTSAFAVFRRSHRFIGQSPPGGLMISDRVLGVSRSLRSLRLVRLAPLRLLASRSQQSHMWLHQRCSRQCRTLTLQPSKPGCQSMKSGIRRSYPFSCTVHEEQKCGFVALPLQPGRDMTPRL